MKKLLTFLCTVLICNLNGQVNFTVLTTPTAQKLLGISFATATTGYACGNTGTVLKTINAGLSWTTLTTSTTQHLWDIKVIPGSAGQKVIAVGDNNTVIKSYNGGTTWTSQSVPFQSGSFVFGIQCLDSLNYIACGGDYATFSGSILKTTDGGASWTKTPVPGSIFLDKVFMLSATKGFAAGTNTSFTDGSLQRTTNGTSWSSVKNSANLLTNVWCNSNSNIISVGLAGQIWKSIDGGTSWTDQSINAVNLFGIQFTDSLKGYVCGGSASGNIILSTTDGGINWSAIPHTFNGAFNSLCIINNVIYIAGDQGRIIKGALAPIVSTGINNPEKENLLVEIYPNPATDKVRIDLIDNPATEYTFMIRDELGKIQKEVSFNQPTLEVSVSELKSGIYFCEVIAGGHAIKRNKLIIQ